MDKLLNVKDIKTITGVGTSNAYKIIRTLNEELEKLGYLTIVGKVPKEYFLKRYNLDK